MHLNRLFLLIPAVALSMPQVHAQDATSAYYLSNVTTQGTARSMGFGNALGSIGGDFSSASVNPAGLGVFRTSELTFTPALRMNSASSQYLGAVTTDNNVRFNINNFGIVITDAPKGKRYERSNWKAISFAFGMNRVADLNRDYRYGGVNYNNSATLAFESDANQYPDDPGSQDPLSVPGYLGYQAYLLNQNTTDKKYYSIVPFRGGIDQYKSVKERGRVNEYTISLGGNYQEQLMLGATLGIPSIKYSVTSDYSEALNASNNSSNPDGFSSFRYRQQLDISGVGVNLKLGAIYKINNSFRIGGALHSPSYYALNETYTPSVLSTVGGNNYEMSVANGNVLANKFNYGITTPWRGILSGSYIMKGIGFITADYEYANYSNTQFHYPWSDGGTTSYDDQENEINSYIKTAYKGTSNFRLGVEGLLTKFFMARAGFGYYSNPFSGTAITGERMDFSGGIGFRGKNFFTDLAFVHSAYQVQNVPYNIDYDYVSSVGYSPVPVATTSFSINNIAMTVGVKF